MFEADAEKIPQELNKIFDGSQDELEVSEQIMDSFSQDPDDYDLSFHFDEKLRAIPEDREDMEAYAALLIAEVRLDLEYEINPLRDQIVANLGSAGAFQLTLGQFELGLEYLEASLRFAETFECSAVVKIQQRLRFCDALRLMRQFGEAEKLFLEAIAEIKNDADLESFEHFALQHLAKLYFDQQKWEQALDYFEKAHSLRQDIGDSDLLASTEQGLKSTQAMIKRAKQRKT